MASPIEQSTKLRHAMSAWAWAVASFLLLYGLWSFPLSVFGPERSRIPGTSCEPQLTNYMLEHFHRWSSGREQHYWDAPFQYPCKSASVHTDDPLGTAPVYSAFRQVGFNRESAYQLWLLSMFALNYTGCFLALRAWTRRTLLAACGAYVFAFGIHNIGLLEQAQVMPKFLAPVALWTFWKALEQRDQRALLLTGVAVSLQLYCSLSIGAMLVIVLFFLWLASNLARHHDPPTTRVTTSAWVASSGLAALLVLVLLFPLLKALWQASWDQTSDAPPVTFPHIRSLFSSHPAALSWHDLSRQPRSAPEGAYFMGALPWIGIICLPILIMSARPGHERKRPIIVLSLTLLFSVLFFTRFMALSLGGALLSLPALHTARMADASIHLQGMLFTLLPLLLVSSLRLRPWMSLLGAVVLPVLVLVDNRIDTRSILCSDKYVVRAQVEDVARSITQQSGASRSVVSYAPVSGLASSAVTADRQDHIAMNAMLAAQRLGLPITNGYPATIAVAGSCADPRHVPIHVIDNLDGFVKHSIDTVAVQLSDGRWLVADTSAAGSIHFRSRPPALLDAFVRIRMNDDRFTLMATNCRSLCVDVTQHERLAASAAHLGDLALFNYVSLDNGRSIWRAANGRYITLDAGGQHLAASVDSISDGQRFILYPLHLPMR